MFEAILALHNYLLNPRTADPHCRRDTSDLNHASTVSYLLLARIRGPHLNSTHGIGSMATEMKPSRLVAQWIPNRSYTTFASSALLSRSRSVR